MTTMTPIYNTMLFCEIYNDVDDFIFDYGDIGIPKTIKEESMLLKQQKEQKEWKFFLSWMLRRCLQA